MEGKGKRRAVRRRGRQPGLGRKGERKKKGEVIPIFRRRRRRGRRVRRGRKEKGISKIKTYISLLQASEKKGKKNYRKRVSARLAVCLAAAKKGRKREKGEVSPSFRRLRERKERSRGKRGEGERESRASQPTPQVRTSSRRERRGEK